MSSKSHERPALTVDVVLFALGEEELKVLLIQRGRTPFRGAWAFPGGFVDVGESPQDAAARELEEETGIRGVQLEQLRAFGDVDRDPRGHTVTIVYVGLVAIDASPPLEAGSDAGQARWWSVHDLPPLAFDHGEILSAALRRLRSEMCCPCIDRTPGLVLPGALVIQDLRSACRAITGRLSSDTRL